jgi:hypothetical protein
MSEYQEKESQEEQTEIYLGDLKLMQACCCAVAGFYCPSVEDCFGAHCKGDFTCFGGEWMLCKKLDGANNEGGECCICLEAKIAMKKPKTVSCVGWLGKGHNLFAVERVFVLFLCAGLNTP